MQDKAKKKRKYWAWGRKSHVAWHQQTHHINLCRHVRKTYKVSKNFSFFSNLPWASQPVQEYPCVEMSCVVHYARMVRGVICSQSPAMRYARLENSCFCQILLALFVNESMALTAAVQCPIFADALCIRTPLYSCAKLSMNGSGAFLKWACLYCRQREININFKLHIKGSTYRYNLPNSRV